MQIFKSDKHKNNLFYSDFFQNRDRNVLLLTHYREENDHYEKINSFILERLVELDLENVPWEDLTALLQKFFLDLNWELLARFRKYDIPEDGVSVFLAIIENDDICFVSCGRFLCGIFSQSGLQELGTKWENYHVKTREALGLLGSVEQDMKVKPLQIKMSENSVFIAVSAETASSLELKSIGYFELKDRINNLYAKNRYPYCLLYKGEKRRSKKQPWFRVKKFRIYLFIMLLMLLFSLYYLIMGRDAVDDRLHITREHFQLTIRNIDILKLQEILPLDYGILLVPQRNIELTVDWESLLPFPVTLKPYFCLRNIYLVSGNSVYAYDKRDKSNVWKTELGNEIMSMDILDSNLMLALSGDNVTYCLKRDSGDIVWATKQIDRDSIYSKAPPYQPVQISLEMDRRLNTSIILLPQDNGLSLINILNGDTLSYYAADDHISYVSDFDLLEKSIYMIKGERLYKVRFDIQN